MPHRHPVHQAIQHAAYFGSSAIPTATELDELKLSQTHRRRVLDACRDVAAIHDTGHHSDAWQAAEQAAAEIVEHLPDSQQDPEYNRRPDPLADVDDPIALAERIPRM